MLVTSKVKNKIRQYLFQTTLASTENIEDDTLIFETGLLDSMGLLFLIEFLKEEFSIETQDEELLEENFKSINSINSFVERKL
ncbi:acyl carrier protein [Muriicola soli]|uniref:Acyl carrier protein n=1 Tax=Muriicola soli TaxID=2507538 RepID=A0A411E8U2_9FLAO|nr:acyl carrier protein [Muriicola soli]QBA63880.1 acyl carrier protein [Muriicola soli]